MRSWPSRGGAGRDARRGARTMHGSAWMRCDGGEHARQRRHARLRPAHVPFRAPSSYYCAIRSSSWGLNGVSSSAGRGRGVPRSTEHGGQPNEPAPLSSRASAQTDGSRARAASDPHVLSPGCMHVPRDAAASAQAGWRLALALHRRRDPAALGRCGCRAGCRVPASGVAAPARALAVAVGYSLRVTYSV